MASPVNIANGRRMPGLRFETVAPPIAEPLPRMDIALFAGFCAGGPVNIPIAVESIAEYQDIFGEDVVLARTAATGPPVRGYLSPAVRAFFRNGGRRCWVLRLANGPVANRFRMPGLFALDAHGSLTPVFASARSSGSWSDGLGVTTFLTSEIVPAISVSLSPFQIVLQQVRAGNVSAGDLLRVTLTDGSYLWVEVRGVDPAAPVPGGGPTLSVRPGRTYYQILSPPGGTGPANPIVEKVTFALWVRNEANNVVRLSALGCSPRHSRYWGAVPDDQVLWREPAPGEQPDTVHAELIAETKSPRFPLSAVPDADALYLPLEMKTLASEEATAEAVEGTPAVRNGLANVDSDLFLDLSLRGTTTRDMMAEADYQRYQVTDPNGAARQLRGIHAALYVDEATLLCVPDVVHLGWDDIGESPLLSPPTLSPPQRAQWWTFLDCSTPQPIPIVADAPGYAFIACDSRIKIAAPALSCSIPSELGTFTLHWTTVTGAVDVLEEATRADFTGAVELTRGAGGSSEVIGKQPGDYYYRVYRIQNGARSDYSNPIGVRIGFGLFSLQRDEKTFDDRTLLDVHRSMLRIAAARGDMFAILSLPQHYREEAALAHAATLASPAGRAGVVPPLNADEGLSFSFGALYHPWLTGREENALDELRTTPADGALAGIYAKRTLARGAWIAAANETLSGVVALDPPIDRNFYQDFLDAQVNLILQQPEGFLCLSSDTLSSDPDYRPVNVRRLLSLLRRLALKRGSDYVFEPNSDEFRRLVQRGLEAVLESMYRDGAFAGLTAADAFQVVTDTSLNPPSSVEQGKFLTEIRVAPSVPLSYLTVRLLQTADRTFVTEGR